MALPTTGITTTLVGNELGVATRNVGNLCKAESVNMWSKTKPVRKAQVTPMVIPDDFQSVNYGIGIPSYATVQALYNNMLSSSPQWIYERPNGGASQPFRIGDFRKYDHTAVKAVAGTFITPRVFKDGGGDKNVRGNIFVAVGSETALSFVDLLTPFPYLGIAFFQDNVEEFLWRKINSTPNQTEVNLNVAPSLGEGIPAGNYKTILFLTNAGRTAFAGINGGIIHTTNILATGGGGGEPGEGGVYISLTGAWSTPDANNRANLTVTVNLKNYFALDTITLVSPAIYLRFHYNDWNTLPYENGEAVYTGFRNSGSNYLLAPTGSSGINIVHTFTNLDYALAGAYHIWWQNGGDWPKLEGTVAPIVM
jgi:hypothetical protein